MEKLQGTSLDILIIGTGPQNMSAAEAR